MSKKNIIQKMSHFFQKEIWKTEAKPSYKNSLYQWLRILFSTVKDFINNKGFDKASTLTFYTLLAIIPLIAIGFGIAQQLGIAEKLAEQIKNQLQSQPQVAEKLIQFSNSTLETTRGGIIAGLGIVLLFWTVIKTIGNIEDFFNDIWRVETSRTLWQKVKRYTPIILFFPIFLVGSSNVIIYMSTTAIAASQAIKSFSFLTPFILSLFNIVSYLMSWSLLSLLYIYLPNTKVSWKAGFIAGIITGFIYFIWQWIYVTFQVKSSSYGLIYGSFAALPLFLIWLNYSWLIVIFGAELCYHIQQESAKQKKDRFKRV